MSFSQASCGLQLGYVMTQQRFVVSLDYHCFHSLQANDFSWHKTSTMHVWSWVFYWKSLFRNLCQVNVRSNAGSSQLKANHLTSWRHHALACETRWCLLLKLIYSDSTLKCFFLGYRYHITKLTISCQSKRDTESCHLCFCLKLLIFYSTKLVQM